MGARRRRPTSRPRAPHCSRSSACARRPPASSRPGRRLAAAGLLPPTPRARRPARRARRRASRHSTPALRLKGVWHELPGGRVDPRRGLARAGAAGIASPCSGATEPASRRSCATPPGCSRRRAAASSAPARRPAPAEPRRLLRPRPRRRRVRRRGCARARRSRRARRPPSARLLGRRAPAARARDRRLRRGGARRPVPRRAHARHGPGGQGGARGRARRVVGTGRRRDGRHARPRVRGQLRHARCPARRRPRGRRLEPGRPPHGGWYFATETARILGGHRGILTAAQAIAELGAERARWDAAVSWPARLLPHPRARAGRRLRVV